MKASRAWADATKRPISAKTHDFILDLVATFGGEPEGDDRVAAAIYAEARAHPDKLGNRLLERVRNRLAAEDLARGDVAVEVDATWLMEIVRGERRPPESRWYYDARFLPAAEYDELVRWVSERQVSS